MRLEDFTASCAAPALGAVSAAAPDFSAVSLRAQRQGLTVRVVRGAKMATVAEVFTEFAAALQFPWYFGENKDAFDECLRDLDEFVGAAPGYLVAVRDAAQVLAAAPAERPWLVSALGDCALAWARRSEPVPFRVVLQAPVGAALPRPFAGATPVFL